MKNPTSPVYSPNYYHSDKEKIIGAIGTFETGDVYYYIPPFPFSGEVETYNFIFAENIWKKDEDLNLVSPLRKITIINANDRFSVDENIDKFFKEQTERLGIKVIYNSKLLSVDGEK